MEAFSLHAIDGYPLAATHFEPHGTPRGTLILHGATATPQRFYRAFAQFLAERGVRVVTYDYRGIGGSRPPSLRGFHATMTEWADLDARAVHRYVAAYHGAGPVAILGHSFGGQLVGLVDEARDACGALFVGAQLGYFGSWPLVQRAWLAVMWHALVPALTATVGYLPGRVGVGEDLPRGVAEEWARWCSHPEYLISGHPDAAERFARFDCPTVLYSFTDDAFAPRPAVDALLGRLTSAPLEHRRVNPLDLGSHAIGHFGFFRRAFKDTLWADALGFLTDTFDGRAPRRVSSARSSWGIREEDVLADLRTHGRQGEPAS